MKLFCWFWSLLLVEIWQEWLMFVCNWVLLRLIFSILSIYFAYQFDLLFNIGRWLNLESLDLLFSIHLYIYILRIKVQCLYFGHLFTYSLCKDIWIWSDICHRVFLISGILSLLIFRVCLFVISLIWLSLIENIFFILIIPRKKRCTTTFIFSDFLVFI